MLPLPEHSWIFNNYINAERMAIGRITNVLDKIKKLGYNEKIKLNTCGKLSCPNCKSSMYVVEIAKDCFMYICPVCSRVVDNYFTAKEIWEQYLTRIAAIPGIKYWIKAPRCPLCGSTLFPWYPVTPGFGSAWLCVKGFKEDNPENICAFLQNNVLPLYDLISCLE